MEQAEDVLKPYYKTIRSLLNLRNEKDILHIFREENMECVWYSHDNWNGGIDYYHLQINVSPFLYDKINQEDVQKKSYRRESILEDLQPLYKVGFV